MHAAQKSDVSNENQFILTDSFEAINPTTMTTTTTSGKTIEITETIEPIETVETIEMGRTVRSVPEILVDSSDIDEIIEDGKMNEFMDYIERIDNDRMESDKLQFREYLEQSKRTRYPSYNYEADKDNVDELADFSIVTNDEHEPKDLAIEGTANSFVSKRAINNRKPNMFAFPMPNQLDDENVNVNENENLSCYRPVIRITPTEDERVEQFLNENCEQQITTAEHAGSAEKLIKSKTTESFECDDENAIDDIDSFESYSRANSPSMDMVRDDSLLSDADMIQFECKQPTNPNYFYNREDSSSSNKSNVLFERSQSRFSELEYIKGRDDWKDSYVRYDIGEEIDSDNYHHLRRHSEAADTLEYIRGREDWLQNELHARRQISLPKIRETREPKIVIQDEIDSDEYHHNFFQNQVYHSANDTNRETDQLYDDATDEVDDFPISNNRTDSNAIVESNTEDATVDSSNDIFEKTNEINEVIEDLLTHEATNNDDIEIEVWDLETPSTSTNLTPDDPENRSKPFILICAPADENGKIFTNVHSTHAQDSFGSVPIEIATPPVDDNISISDSLRNQNNKQNFCHDTNEFIKSEIQNEVKIRSQHRKKSELDVGSPQTSDTDIRAKSERPELMRMNLLSPIDRKLRRTLSFENVEDLIQEVSLGPWFHK